MSGMWKLGPGVIGKDQTITDGKQRCSGPCEAGFIERQQSSPEQDIPVRRNQQSVELIGRESPLQQKQLDSQSEWIALGQTLCAIYRQAVPVEVGDFLQSQSLAYHRLGISGAGDVRNRRMEGRHIGIVDQEAGGLNHWLKNHLAARNSWHARAGLVWIVARF